MLKKVYTTMFIGRSALYGMRFTPHNFTDPQREKFHDYLLRLNPADTQTKAWVYHLLSVNMYCDKKGVTLLASEREGLQATYTGETTVHKAMDSEKAIFGINSDLFEAGSNNKVLREDRPPKFIMPNGDLTFRSAKSM